MVGGISWVEYPHARIRKEIEIERGDVTRFVVQLEYNVNPGVLDPDDWREVARFDHEPNLGMGHDVREEGLHMDVYRDGEKVAVKEDFRTVSLPDAPGFCENYFERHADWLLARFERWHGIDGNWNAQS